MIDSEKPRELRSPRVDPPRPNVPRLLPAVPIPRAWITCARTIETGTIETSAARSESAVWIATAGGLGYAPFAPGTFGSLGGVALFLALARLDLGLYVLSVTALGFLGVWASDAAERHFERADDGRIVIDEVVGQLIALAPLVPLWSLAETGRHASLWPFLVVTGFVLFRVLDIWKPGPVRWAERRFEGGVGVMADDVVAGLLGGLLLAAAAWAPLIAGSTAPGSGA